MAIPALWCDGRRSLPDRAGAPAVPRLIGALKDANKYVRWGAAEALGRIDDPRAVEPLIAALRDHDKDVRWKAAISLGSMRANEAVCPLIRTLKDDDTDVPWGAATALGEIGYQHSIEHLSAACQREADPRKR